MPRLTDNTFIQRHHILRDVWLKLHQIYHELPSDQYWDLHSYFRPSKELTNTELLEHRRTITKLRPSLPHRAGKAYAAIRSAQREAQFPVRAQLTPTPVSLQTAVSTERIRIKAILKPEPDFTKIAQVILGVAEQMEREAQDGEEAA